MARGVTRHSKTGRFDAHLWVTREPPASGRRGRQLFVGSWSSAPPAVLAVALARAAFLGEPVPPGEARDRAHARTRALARSRASGRAREQDGFVRSLLNVPQHAALRRIRAYVSEESKLMDATYSTTPETDGFLADLGAPPASDPPPCGWGYIEIASF